MAYDDRDVGRSDSFGKVVLPYNAFEVGMAFDFGGVFGSAAQALGRITVEELIVRNATSEGTFCRMDTDSRARL